MQNEKITKATIMGYKSTFFVTFASKTFIHMAEYKLNRIRVALAEKDLTNKWLADKVGVSKMTVSRWVSNKRQPPLEQLFTIANALGVDVRDLIMPNQKQTD